MWFRKYKTEEGDKSMNEAKGTDFYRVGVTTNGNTTLTISSENGVTMTLTMNAASVRQMIRLLESTLPQEETADE